MPPTPRIYLDHAATTPVLPAVVDAMRPWLAEEYGNPSSLHQEGRRAKEAIDQAREIVSGALGCLFAEVLFTGSGTEAANMAIVGAALSNNDSVRNRILIGAADHHCALHTAPILTRLGYKVELIPVLRDASLDMERLGGMLASDVLLVSVMHANNELGTVQPIVDIANAAHEVGALYHCDAVQAFLNLDHRSHAASPEADESNQEHVRWERRHLAGSGTPSSPHQALTTGEGPDTPDLITFAAHKINGPKGVGAIYIRAGVKIAPIAVGGGQEREMRAGTENVAGIVGFGAAVQWHLSNPQTAKREARDRFLDTLVASGAVPTVAARSKTLPGHAHVRFPGVGAESMLILLDRLGVAASSVSACSSGSLEPSHVLLACGYSLEEAKEGLRFTFGHGSTLDEAERAASIVVEAADRIRRVGTSA